MGSPGIRGLGLQFFPVITHACKSSVLSMEVYPPSPSPIHLQKLFWTEVRREPPGVMSDSGNPAYSVFPKSGSGNSAYSVFPNSPSIPGGHSYLARLLQAPSLQGVRGGLCSEIQFPGIGEEDEVGIQVVSGTLGISEESSSTEIPV